MPLALSLCGGVRMPDREKRKSGDVEKGHPFAFCAPDLIPASSYRLIVLDGTPEEHLPSLFEACAKLWRKDPQWALLSEAGEAHFMEIAESASPFLILDATGLSSKDLFPRLKLVFRRHPELRVLLLTDCEPSPADLPLFLGRAKLYRVGDELKSEGVDYSKSDTRLLHHSRRITPKYTMGDLVLGPKTEMKLGEVMNYLRTRASVETEWGFKEKHTRGHGVTIVFHGPSGTGKTMAAEVIAGELGLPLYQIDLSSIMSKWVGETEKNLKAIFRAAEGVKGVLLFDEGDAIFGNRVSVQGSQDRFANLEVNYLLQELESFDGIIILSTNHENNMDEAFLRRFTYAINIGLPSPDQRTEIWKKNLPEKLPVDSGVNFSHLSQFALTGGNIRNCIREAAARAYGQKRSQVSQLDFLWAIKRELQKHDKPFDRALVGEDYWRQVGPDWEYLYFNKAKTPKAAEPRFP